MKYKLLILSLIAFLISFHAKAQNKFFEKEIKIKNSLSTNITKAIELTDGYLLLASSADSPSISPKMNSYSLIKCNEFGDTISTFKYDTDVLNFVPLLFKKNATGDKVIMLAYFAELYNINGSKNNFLVYAQIDLKTLSFDSYHKNLLKHDSLSSFHISSAHIIDSNNIIINGEEFIADNPGYAWPTNRLFYLSCNSNAQVNYIHKLHDIEDRYISVSSIVNDSSNNFLMVGSYQKNDSYGRGICVYSFDHSGKVKIFKKYTLNLFRVEFVRTENTGGGNLLLTGYTASEDSVPIYSSNSELISILINEIGDTLFTKHYNLRHGVYIYCTGVMPGNSFTSMIFDNLFTYSQNGDSIRYEPLQQKIYGQATQLLSTVDDGILLIGLSSNGWGYIAKTSIYGSFNGVNYTLLSNQLSIYPNPVTQNFMISLPNNHDKYFLTLTDITGKLIKQETIQTIGNHYQFERGNISNGLYILRLTDSNGVQ
ncbi:MAG: T9SS type A sorting domain-containing protein [Bacteroidetes bacterium]|nr:T9SS type A sorting domain-containing protein [Bacteroidota bacterium]